jgi:hypothetical protein
VDVEYFIATSVGSNVEGYSWSAMTGLSVTKCQYSGSTYSMISSFLLAIVSNAL